MGTSRSETLQPLPAVDVIVVGAGLGGLYAHHKLRKLGFSVQGFEAGTAVGGTWYWNRYPGARCDVESLDYTYSFDPDLLHEWAWSERYATQPEILRYIDHVADRFDLRRDVVFGARVIAATFDEAANAWTVETDRGHRVTAKFLLTTVGCLSTPKAPDFPGLEDFAGRWVQTSAWPHQPVEIAGQRVAVIGTGSSGIQTIPVLAEHAARLTVFQRTPNFSLPAKNGPIDPAYEAKIRADYVEHCRRNFTTKAGVQPKVSTGKSALEVSDAERSAAYETAWNRGGGGLTGMFKDVMTDIAANDTAAEFVRGKIREIVKDPVTAERLSPRDHPFATKRICLDSDYFATFNRPSVELVDIRATPIERITRDGVKTSEKEYPVDLLVFATGFDAVTGPLLAMNIQGVGGVKLAEVWDQGPRTFLGLTIAGFPNLFTVNGPGSPSVLANMIPTIEQHVDWIAGCMAHMRASGLDRIDADPQAQDDWAVEVRKAADGTLYPRAKSWYLGDNVDNKPRVFLAYVGGFADYIARCEEIAAAGYRGFRLSSVRAFAAE
jgi:cyclohexanone monooxygenase